MFLFFNFSISEEIFIALQMLNTNFTVNERRCTQQYSIQYCQGANDVNVLKIINTLSIGVLRTCTRVYMKCYQVGTISSYTSLYTLLFLKVTIRDYITNFFPFNDPVYCVHTCIHVNVSSCQSIRDEPSHDCAVNEILNVFIKYSF